MTEIETITRKWGNSLGITIPREIVEKENIGENQRITIDIKPSRDIKSLRGLIKFKKSAQEIKDEMRAGWK